MGEGKVDLNASLPATGYLATGAGTASSAIPAGQVNYMTVAAGVTYNKSFTNPQGKVSVQFNSMNKPDGSVDTVLHTYQIVSNSIAGLTAPVPGAVYQFTAKCNVTDITNPASPINVDGGATMQVTTINSGQTYNNVAYPNGGVNVEIQPKSGGVWVAAGWSGAQPTFKQMAPGGGVVGQ
jgi:hypothetical protein